MINEYINKYGKRLYGLCVTLCGNSVDADDLYQDTWIKVVKHIDSYDSTKEFEPWLTRICVNTYRNSLRRLSKSPFLNHFQSTESKDALLENIPSEEHKDYRVLYEAIDNLSGKLRMTIILYYFQYNDVESVANVLGIPSGTVKSRLAKARKILKEVLKDEFDLQF